MAVYHAFWCETVTRKWRWLHPGHGARAPTFKNDWARGHQEQEEQKTRQWSNCTDHREALTKTTDCTCKAKKVEGHDKSFYGASRL